MNNNACYRNWAAAATRAIVTVPGFLRARKQPKLAIYLLKIHNEYDELCRKIK